MFSNGFTTRRPTQGKKARLFEIKIYDAEVRQILGNQDFLKKTFKKQCFETFPNAANYRMPSVTPPWTQTLRRHVGKKPSRAPKEYRKNILKDHPRKFF